ncbi:hypothetical protein [Bacteroides cellulosilyticus]|jgi:hypothetical protein|uniref:hypothetical protein n=1 Tax=Bacteroides cellulosilyticus TaxID=246787 RepID=UPI000AAB2AD5|nr:hypothetical protein [Bacteroides oleiciplenus]DAF18102.1 MAG TPA: hypothetical protein [Caudoviricetes sp.]DAT08680.1 MAG TPA: hypothetical protein [Caudoviricetes sp.]DAU89232.1 MAG TPA: hypothetical protein [Caudoviricetes sp.]
MKIYKKKYAIYGMIEQSCVFPMGTGHIRVDFRHGSLTTAGIVPATFTTPNPVIQQAIENSPKFKAGVIKEVESVLIRDTGTLQVQRGGTQKSGKVVVESIGQNTTSDISESGETSEGAGVYPDVKNSQQAKDILMGEPYNIPLADLGNKAAIQAKAAAIGISFPNWK